MNRTTTPGMVPAEAVEEAGVSVPTIGWWRRWFWAPVKLLVGVALMQTPAGAVVVAGWLQRFLQRAVYRSWWRKSRGRLGTFEEFVVEEPEWHAFRHVPNWVLAQNFGTRLGAGVVLEGGWFRRFLGRFFGGLASNIGVGFRALTNVAVLTVPGTVLWWMGWWGGWQNSFHKGYEHFLVGPLVSWVGILLFIAAMFYLPMALGRQASTGEWRSFWQGRTIWTLVRTSWLPSAFVAALFAVANGLVMGLKSWPQFLPQARLAALEKRGLDPTEAFQRGLEAVDWSDLTDGQALQVLNLHYAGSALVVLLVLMGLKRAVAWLYSVAVLRSVQRGELGEGDLAATEWRLLRTLGLLEVRESRVRPVLVRFVAWAGSRVGRGVCAVAVFVAWFLFVGAIYVSEFLAYHPAVGWLNQPLVQLPWFRYIPPHLEDPAPGWLAAAGLWVVAGLANAWHGRWRAGGTTGLSGGDGGSAAAFGEGAGHGALGAGPDPAEIRMGGDIEH